MRDRIRAALPHVIVMDAVGSSESGAQMSTYVRVGAEVEAATFTPRSDTVVISADFAWVLQPGEGPGWLARRDLVPLGYLGDAAKTAKTFPTIDGVRWSVPGDRANVLGRADRVTGPRFDDHQLWRGERFFAEQVERAIAVHLAVYDVVWSAGPPSGGAARLLRSCSSPRAPRRPTRNSPRCAHGRSPGTKVPKVFVRA